MENELISSQSECSSKTYGCFHFSTAHLLLRYHLHHAALRYNLFWAHCVYCTTCDASYNLVDSGCIDYVTLLSFVKKYGY